MRTVVLLLLLANLTFFGFAQLDSGSTGETSQQLQPEKIKLLTAQQVAALGLPASASGSDDGQQAKQATTGRATIQNESFASAVDAQQARKFLADLPAACAGTRAAAASDGTITIRLACEEVGKSLDGIVQIKDGVVTKVR